MTTKDVVPRGNNEGKIGRTGRKWTEVNATTVNAGNVAASGNTTVTGYVSAAQFSGTGIKNEDDMASNSDTHLATQQSIKAYVDAQDTAQDLDITADSGGPLSIDLDGETLTIAGGVGIATSANTNTITVTLNVDDSTVEINSDSLRVKNSGITFAKLAAAAVVTQSEGIGSNDNDTTLPTSAAVKAYVDAQTITKANLQDNRVVTAAGAAALNGEANLTFDGSTLTVSGEVSATTFDIGGTNITADATEINKLDGVTATTAELNYLDITTLGTAQASKSVTVSAGNKITLGSIEIEGTNFDINGGTINGATITGNISGNATTATTLANARTIGGVSFNGSANIVPNTISVADDENTNSNRLILFADSTGTQQPKNDGDFHYNPYSGKVTIGGAIEGGGQITGTNLKLNSGVIYGPTDGDIYIRSDASVKIHLDDDADSTSNFVIYNGANQAKFQVDESGNTIISGNLTVDGTTTTVNSTTVQIDDLNLQLADGAAAASSVDGGGITLAHTGTDFTLAYNHASTAWKSNIDFDIASSKDYKISGTSVLNANGAVKVQSGVAGVGLAHSSGVLSVDLNEASAATVDVANDSIAIIDANASNATKKESISDLVDRIASTGLDASNGQLSVDVSDFMTNGVNNQIVTATGTDGMNAEANLTFNGSTLNVNGTVTATEVSATTLDIGGTNITATATELNKLASASITTAELNILDGGTGASSPTLITSDKLIVNDAGVMKQVTMATLDTYMETNMNHDSISGFVANEHISHSDVDIIAGAGLTGGGDLTSDRTLNAIAGTGITVNANDIQTNDSQIVHDNLSGFVANEHISHSSVSITAGVGLSGGGDLTDTRILALDAHELSALGTTADTGDYFVVVDSTDNSTKKVLWTNTGFGASNGAILSNGVNNRLVTAASTTTINGESNLTFDGSTLALAGDLNVDSNTLFVDASDSDVRIGTTSAVGSEKLLVKQSSTGQGTGILVSNGPSSGNEFLSLDIYQTDLATITAGTVSNSGNCALAFRTANTTESERMRITHDGKVGIGEAAPTTSLAVGGDLGLTDSSSVKRITIEAGAAADAQVVIGEDSNEKGWIGWDHSDQKIIIGTQTPSTTYNNTVEIEDGDVTVAGTLTANAFSGDGSGLSGVGSTAASADGTNSTHYVSLLPSATGTVSIKTDPGLTYNPSTNLLTLTGDLRVGGGDIFGTTDSNLTIRSDQNMYFYIDDDGGESSKEFRWYDDSAERMVLDQSGNLQIDGDLTVSGGDISFGGNAALKDSGGHTRIYFSNTGVLSLRDPSGNTEMEIADTAVTVSGDLFVNDYARIDALRVGTTSSDPGDGHLVVEADVQINGGDIRDAGGTARISIPDNASTTIKDYSGNTELTIADGSVTVAGDLFVDGGDIEVGGSAGNIKDNQGHARLKWTTNADKTQLCDAAGTGRVYVTADRVTSTVELTASSGLSVGAASSGYGLMNVKQDSNTSDGGLAVENTGGGRSLRLWCDGSDLSHIDSGGTGANTLIMNQGAGWVGMGSSTAPDSPLHVRRGAVTNADHDTNYNVATFEGNEARVQILSDDTAGNSATLSLTNAPATGNNKHWLLSQRGIDNSNRFEIGYLTNSDGDLDFHEATRALSIDTAGRVSVGSTPLSTTQFYVKESSNNGNFAATFFHDGNNSGYYGIKIQSGADGNVSGVDGYFISMYDGNGGGAGSITHDNLSVSYGAFTGEHYGELAESVSKPEYGTLVSVTKSKTTGKHVDYVVTPTTTLKEKAVIGVYSNEFLNSPGGDLDGKHSIWSLGDGHILVCKEGGNIEIGDYICSSTTAGIGMKQDDDLLHNYTVAKATESVTWKSNSKNPKLISCTYHCG